MGKSKLSCFLHPGDKGMKEGAHRYPGPPGQRAVWKCNHFDGPTLLRCPSGQEVAFRWRRPRTDDLALTARVFWPCQVIYQQVRSRKRTVKNASCFVACATFMVWKQEKGGLP